MSQSTGTNVSDIGSRASAVLRKAHRGIAKGADTAVAFVLKQAGIRIDPNPAAFEEHVMLHMTVIAPCGRIVGHVEEVDVDCIKLAPIQGHYPKSTYVSWDWIERVGSCVYLNRDNEEITNSN